MGTVHDLLENQGKAAAIAEFGRPAVEAAAAYMADEGSGIGFLYSGWCQAALPHRKQPDGKPWQIKSDFITLIVEPGHKPGHDEPVPMGVPYGSRARLIMLYLQSEALRTRSREVELGGSMRDWLSRMGVSIGGKSVAMVRDQAERILRCRLSFNMTARLDGGQKMAFKQQSIVDEASLFDYDPARGELFTETAKLSEAFFAELQRHPVPLLEAAVRAINNNSMALDLYAWLAYRLHVLKGPTPVTWPSLKGQFGTGFDRVRNFRQTFLENLRLALAVYPDARVEVEQRGLILVPSRPPVTPRIVPAGRVHAFPSRQEYSQPGDIVVRRTGSQRW
jgi:hypothetical protein